MGRKRSYFLLVMILTALFPARAAAQDEVSWLLEQINALRASVGVHGYVLNPQLSAAATQHSEYMATTCDVSHTESNGSTPSTRAAANGYTGSRISENIYGGTNANASYALNFWINSPIHYRGLTHDVDNEIGIGIAHGPCGNYYTLVFGYRADVNAPPAPPTAVPAAQEAGQAPTSPPPTRYVPPPPTRTPTATIPTLTPSATWTITPTFTPFPTLTPPLPTETPLVLPTVPALGEAVAVAASPTPILVTPPTNTSLPPTVIPVVVSPDTDSGRDGFEVRDLIPFALLGQIVLIGLVGLVYFRHAHQNEEQ